MVYDSCVKIERLLIHCSLLTVHFFKWFRIAMWGMYLVPSVSWGLPKLPIVYLTMSSIIPNCILQYCCFPIKSLRIYETAIELCMFPYCPIYLFQTYIWLVIAFPSHFSTGLPIIFPLFHHFSHHFPIISPLFPPFPDLPRPSPAPAVGRGMSGADLANLLNEGAIVAARQNKAEIDADDIANALDGRGWYGLMVGWEED